MDDFSKRFISSDNFFSFYHSLSNQPISNMFRPHRQNTFEIILFISGVVDYYIEGNCYVLKPGDILIINHNELHNPRIDEKTPYERIVFEISEEIVAGFWQEDYDFFACFNNHPLGKNNLFPANIAAQYHLSDIIQQIITHCEKGGAENEIFAKCSIIMLLVHLNRARREMETNPDFEENQYPKIEKLIKYINENLHADLSLDALAKQCFLSKYHLCHVFKQSTGFTLNQYISYKRIMLVNKLISDGTDITDACYAAGFNDYSTFYKCYKKIMSHAPKTQKNKPEQTPPDLNRFLE